jgi:ABC-type multidrug transport system fused ATPase/permease subunit
MYCHTNLPDSGKSELYIEMPSLYMMMMMMVVVVIMMVIVMMKMMMMIIIIIIIIIWTCPILAKNCTIKDTTERVHYYTSTYVRKQGYNWPKHWYEHVPKSVGTGQGGNVTVLWNQQVRTDRTIPNNKPDITNRDNEKRTRMLKDVGIPEDRNVIKKSRENSKI